MFFREIRILFFFLIVLFFSSWFVQSNTFIHKLNQSDTTHKFLNNFFPKISKKDEIIKHTAYTLCYNEKHEQATWVAYRLTDEMCNNNGEERSNNFRVDPLVKTYSATPDDYKKSGYDRGHLCPAGDMGWSELTMSESFFMSNMSPQVPTFNRGIWKYLEADVREWAKKNYELFIVTAGVLEDSLPTIGFANKISIPKYYYKIVLDYRLPEYKAIGFVMPNKGSKKSVFNYAVTIDSIERLTGIDFFYALPDSIENYLESHIDTLLWKIK